MALDGKTPSDEAGITIDGDDKWLTLMRNAVIYEKSNVVLSLFELKEGNSKISNKHQKTTGLRYVVNIAEGITF